MKAAVYADVARIEMRETPEPVLDAGDVLLRVFSCGLCGTDIRKIRHGLVKAPTILGHEVAGEVVRIGRDVKKFEVGDRVVVAHHTPCYTCHYCRHENFSMCRRFKISNLDPGGFSEFVRIPATHVDMTAYKIPEEMTYDQAIHMEPTACVLRNVKRAKFYPGDTALIIGLGSMGLTTGLLLQHRVGRVIATDLREERRALAVKLGFDVVLSGDDPSLSDVVRSQTEGRGADLVVLTAGNPSVYSSAVQYVRDGGYISIFAGLEPGAKATYDVNELYAREITIYSSYSPSPQELMEALELLRTKTIDMDFLQARAYGLSELSKAVDAVARQSILKAIIRPNVMEVSS